MAHDRDLQLVLDTANELEKTPAGVAKAPAGPFRGQLGTFVTWLRDHGITLPAILAKLPAILTALQGGDWQAVVTALIGLFHLPPTTSAPAAPGA